MLRNMVAAGSILAAFSFLASAQQPRGAASQPTASADTGDFVQDGLKFHRMTPPGFSPSTYMVTDVSTSNPAGELMDRGGERTYLAFAGYDKAKIQTAWEKHMNAGGASAAAQTASTAKDATLGTTAAQNSAATAPATGFDAATKTVALSDGRSVTFVDNDSLKVQMPAPAGTKTYDLHFHKAGAGGFMKGWAGREQGRVGGSLGGGGVTIVAEAQQVGGVNIPGGQVYDTAGGTVYGSSGFQQAKAVTAAVREAVDVIKSSGQSDLAKLNVVKSLLSNNLGI